MRIFISCCTNLLISIIIIIVVVIILTHSSIYVCCGWLIATVCSHAWVIVKYSCAVSAHRLNVRFSLTCSHCIIAQSELRQSESSTELVYCR